MLRSKLYGKLCIERHAGCDISDDVTFLKVAKYRKHLQSRKRKIVLGCVML
jgi:hypothetical protein